MSPKKRGNSRYIFFLCGIALLLLGTFFGVRYLIRTMDYFMIESIEIEGNVNLQKDFLYTIAKELLGQNLYLTPDEEIISRYENVVRVKEVKVHRVLPGKLKLRVKERLGVFFIRTRQGSIHAIDANRILLDNDNYYEGENFPIIATQLDADKLIIGQPVHSPVVDRVFAFRAVVLEEDEQFFNDISELYVQDDHLFLVEMHTGYTILFGEGDLIRKIRQYRFLAGNTSIEQDKIIDLRFADQLVIRPEE